MDWSNERYVRIYTRKTVKYLLYPWQSRAIRNLVFLELDRAGVLECDSVDPVDAISAAIMIPREVVAVGLPPLIADGTLVFSGTKLYSPNFIEAQEAAKSDRERQKESRYRRRDLAKLETDVDITKCDTDVTKCDDTVTTGHEQSHAVTPCHSVLYCAVPSLTDLKKETSESDDIRQVFDFWSLEFSPKAKPKMAWKKRL